jgi:hypothetical protein
MARFPAHNGTQLWRPSMLRRVSSILLFASLGALALAACGGSDSTPTALDSRSITTTMNGQTPHDETFLDQLKEGTFTVCKVVDTSDHFTFNTTAVGPGVATAPLYQPTVSLGNDECADVYTAPSGPDIDPDTVTITEDLPANYQVDRVAIWSKDAVGDGTFDISFHELPAGTTSVSGAIDANKIGCVVIFYNSLIPQTGECTRTPGYWKTHPDDWPVDSIDIGGRTYTKDEAIAILWTPERGDKTRTLFRALLAAKLNALAGTDVSCVSGEMDYADMWLAVYEVGSNVRGDSDAWYSAEPLSVRLDDYNNGLVCAPHCDDDTDPSMAASQQ